MLPRGHGSQTVGAVVELVIGAHPPGHGVSTGGRAGAGLAVFAHGAVGGWTGAQGVMQVPWKKHPPPSKHRASPGCQGSRNAYSASLKVIA
jgi:hypothetical protein